MTATDILHGALRSSRARAAVRALAFALPILAMLVALAWRIAGAGWTNAVFATGGVVATVGAWLAMRRIDTHWLARRLDERDPRMEDSAALLFTAPGAISPLERLQQKRLQQRLETSPPPELRPAWSGHKLFATFLLTSLATAIILLWPTPPAPTQVAQKPPATRTAETTPTHTSITGQRFDIAPPGYTRLPNRREDGFEAKVPEGASVRWTLRFSPAPAAASLVFHDGRKVAMTREGDDWIATRRIDKPMLYRIVLADGPPLRPDRLHRIDVTVDQPPQLKVIAPDNTLTMRGANQRVWSLSFEANDDYGLASAAPLRITLAQGSGENITFQERSLPLQGRGAATRKRYAHTFELGSLNLAAGDDLVVQLSVADNRAGSPQTTRSASYILRWPPEDVAESTGLDGLVKKTLPAYFRSQRQIIIDSEDLLAQRRKLAADKFVERSDAIGVDQRLLRLRYGQFLGEETQGGPRALLPTADADAEAEAHEASEKPAHEEGAAAVAAEDTHDHDATGTPSSFGQAEDVLETYGHTHDDAEAATLLDPETRKTLKAALDQMWQAELHLRQGHPDIALPYEYKALDYIKQVQQAGRVYLARVGPELPPIDESRRLSGERTGLAPRGDVLVAADATSPLLAALWRAIETPPGTTSPQLDLDGVERWLRANERRVPDALSVIAAIDAVRREPDCASCRQLLRSRLWPLLPRPLANPAPRLRPDPSGQAYLDALRQGSSR